MIQETPEQLFNKLRIESHDLKLHSYGLAYIFNEKKNMYDSLIKFLTFLGIVIPILIGLIALGYELDSFTLKLAKTIAIPISIFQCLVSALALVYKWGDNLLISSELSHSYAILSNDFKMLAEYPPDEYEKFKNEFLSLKKDYEQKGQHSPKIKEYELRKGMRYALRQFQVKCYECGIIPISMESTNCGVCGKFSFRHKF